jgi:hypothetical protein
MEQIDILTIDESIKKFYKTGEDNIPLYQEKLESIKKIYESPGLTLSTSLTLAQEIRELECLIEELTNKTIYCFYERDTADIIQDYKILLSKPIKMSFMTRSVQNNTEKIQYIASYVKITKECYDSFKFPFLEKITPPLVEVKRKTCTSCNLPINCDVIEGRTSICVHCGVEEELFGSSSSYKDANRVNVTSKYTYERKIHFKDCMNQYQGKQNATIPDKCYQDIIHQLNIHGLLIGNETTPKDVRFAKVQKSHIYMFLKETNWAKHYEDVNLIFHTITGKRLDDISHLESKLLDDFDELSSAYDRKFKQINKIDRKSFINTQYVLFQLLRRHKHACKEEDFNMLKTLDRKSFLDDICSQLFGELGWNFTPIF